MGWFLSRDPDNYDIWHSSKTREGEFNFIGYNNPEVDKLLEEGSRVFDQAERAKIYRRLHEILSEDEPYTFLYVTESLLAVHNRFREVRQALIGVGYNFIDWYVPVKEQKYKFFSVIPSGAKRSRGTCSSQQTLHEQVPPLRCAPLGTTLSTIFAAAATALSALST